MTRWPCWGQSEAYCPEAGLYASGSIQWNFLSKNLHENRVWLPKERTSFTLDHQHGHRDVTCKLAIILLVIILLEPIYSTPPSFPPAPLMARPDFSSASCTFVVTKTYVSRVRTQWPNFCDLWICLCLLDTGKQAKLATFDFCVLNGFGRKPSLGAPEALLPVIIKHDK